MRQAPSAIILAAGMGTRMKSAIPKALHPIAGAPMLTHVLRTALSLSPERLCVVTGHEAEQVANLARALVPDAAIAVQTPQRGTAHAAMRARDALGGVAGDVFILYGDTPLIQPQTLRRMAKARADGAAVVVLGFETATPDGYGRLIANADGALAAIVEEKDASEAERAVRLCNSGVMCVDGTILFALLDRVGCDNAKGEFYLTDIVALARADGRACAVVECSETEVQGVNSRADLAHAEAAYQARRRAEAMDDGATLSAPETVFFAHDTRLGRDVVIGPNVVFGPGAEIADGAQIRAFCHLEGCSVASGAIIGPFARLRPGAQIGREAHIGNFVEIKNTVIAEGAKANHLSYIGDAAVGARANIGAGTITCNYDGHLKYHTEIGVDAFIGSNTALIAPVVIGDQAIVAAGSTITGDVPAGALATARGRQQNKPGLAARLRKALAAAKTTRAEAAESGSPKPGSPEKES